MPEIIIGLVLLIAFSICAFFYLLNRTHEVCSRCGEKMKVIWVGKEIDARKETLRFGGKRMIGGTVTQYTPFLRCIHCGHEIPLVSDNSKRG